MTTFVRYTGANSVLLAILVAQSDGDCVKSVREPRSDSLSAAQCCTVSDYSVVYWQHARKVHLPFTERFEQKRLLSSVSCTTLIA